MPSWLRPGPTWGGPTWLRLRDRLVQAPFPSAALEERILHRYRSSMNLVQASQFSKPAASSGRYRLTSLIRSLCIFMQLIIMAAPSVSANSSIPGLKPSFRPVGSRNIQVMRYGKATSGHARNRLPNMGACVRGLGWRGPRAWRSPRFVEPVGTPDTVDSPSTPLAGTGVRDPE